MKVLFLVTDDWFFWSHRLHLARAVLADGGEVVVATGIGQLRKQIEAEGFRMRDVRFSRSVPGQLRNTTTLWHLVRIYREEQPDLVHHVSFLPILYGTLAARLCGVKAVVNAVTGLGHAFVSEGFSPLRWAIERCYKSALGHPNARVVFQNRDDEALMRAKGLVPPGASRVILGSGVDTERFCPAPEPNGVPVFLLVARMLWSKGIGVFIEAGRILRERGVAHELRFAGQPHATNPDAIPVDQLHAWGKEDCVRWLGQCENVPQLMQSAHVVCLPSYYREGVPLALIEGAACGRPLVCTDAPGCREIVAEGINGFLVPRRDPHRLADALQALGEKPLLRREMGRRGRQRVEAHFSKEVVNDEILAVYRELLCG